MSKNPSFVAVDSTKTDAATDKGENHVGTLSRNHIRLRAEGAVDLGGEWLEWESHLMALNGDHLEPASRAQSERRGADVGARRHGNRRIRGHHARGRRRGG